MPALPPTPGSATPIALAPVPYARCIGGECVALPLTPVFTKTRTITPTVTPTSTPTITPTSSATQAVPTTIDPYKCYRIRQVAETPGKEVRITDNFGRTRTRLLKPFFFCNPSVSRNVDDAPGVNGEQVNPEAQLICFKIRDENAPQLQPKAQSVRTKFGDKPAPPMTDFTLLKDVSFVRGQLICLPAVLVRPTPMPLPTCAKTPAQCQAGFVCNAGENLLYDVRTPTPTWTPNDN